MTAKGCGADDAEARARALRPEVSCIVQAPAGSGKTTLLVNRFAALLAKVELPEQILAITFTRKATAEMRQRVLALLSPDGLNGLRTQERALAEGVRARDAQQGWNLIDNPARLKIQTIDSFAASLVGALPLGANTDRRAQPTELAGPLYEQAVDGLFKRLREDPLGADVGRLLMLQDNNPATTGRLVTEMLARRDQWLNAVLEVFHLHQEQPEALGPLLNNARAELVESIANGMARALGPELMEELRWMIDLAARHQGPQGSFWATAKARCMTAAGQFRKRLDKRNGFPAHLKKAKQRALRLIEALRGLGLERRLAALANLPETPLSDWQIQELASVCVALALAVLDLNAAMAEQRATDFPQLNIAAARALRDGDAPTDLALALDYRIRHILVDEFQDTSNAQFELFSLLLEGWSPTGENSFFAVGDPMQSIYRFRDADVALFQRAQEDGINQLPLQPLRLNANFRSAPGLVDWFNNHFPAIMGNRADRLTGQVGYSPSTARRAGDGEVSVRLFARPSLEAEALARHVQALRRSEPKSSIAILVRSRAHLPTILETLRRQGIPWQATDIDPLAETPAVLDLLSLAAALSNSRNRLAWLSVLRTPWVGLDLPDLERAAKLRAFNPENLAHLKPQLTSTGADRLGRLLKALNRWLPRRYEGAPRTPLEAVWLECGGAAAYADPAVLDHAQRFLELVDRLGADGWDVDLLRQLAEGLFAADSGETQLQILTVHKAKGLEFDHVLLPCLDKGVRGDSAPVLRWRLQGRQLLMATKGSGALYGWLAEEDKARTRHELQRLLYVACTRAKRSLLLTACVGLEEGEASTTTTVAMIKQPREGSMLALLWPGMREEMPTVETGGAAANQPANAVETNVRSDDLVETGGAPADQPAAPLKLHQLRDGFVWSPPKPQPLALPDTLAPKQGGGEDPAAGSPQVILGELVHRCLCLWGRNGPPPDVHAWLEARRGQWQGELLATGLAEAERRHCIAEAERQLSNVLLDQQGRWLLAPHDQAASEFAVMGVLDGVLVSAYFDRVFKHEGMRWIVEFKTDRTASDPASIRQQTLRHCKQLARYRALAEQLYDEPIRTALYLTAIPKLIEVDA